MKKISVVFLLFFVMLIPAFSSRSPSFQTEKYGEITPSPR